MIAAAAAGAILGLAGTGHCGVMCGPLALLAQSGSGNAVRPGTAWRAGWYHAGRTASYITLGAAAGTAGSVVASAGLGRVLALAAAGALIVQALRTISPGRAGEFPGLRRRVSAATAPVSRWLARHHLAGAFAFGALTGLLPCGLLYGAITAAAGMGDPAAGAIFMAGFAAGTSPLLLGIGLTAGRLTLRVRGRRGLTAAALILLAVLLALRGGGTPHAGHALDSGHPAPRKTGHQHLEIN